MGQFDQYAKAKGKTQTSDIKKPPYNNDKKDPPGGTVVPKKPKPKSPSGSAGVLVGK